MILQPELNKNLSETEIYKSLLPVMENIVVPGEPVISVLGNVAAVLKEAFVKVSWVGFYLLKEGTLYLAAFQGKPACTQIPSGKGVCGTSVVKKQSIIVDNVEEFDGHIACDSDSRSEMVVPVMKNGIVYAVIDIDSTQYSAFGENDKYHIEQIAGIISSKIDLEILKNIII